MAAVCLLRCPVFLSPFLSYLLMLSPGCVGESSLLPAPTALPAAARGGRHKSCLSAGFGRQLMAQQCFRNLCSATGAGRGMNTLLLFPWGLVGISEFLSTVVGSDRKGSSTNTL